MGAAMALAAFPLNLDLVALAKDGVFTFDSFQAVATTQPKWLVEGLIADPSVNLLVGDSNLGKTPLAITLGVCVAAGVPFCGWQVKQGRVLYCDAESGKPTFNKMVKSVSETV